MFRSLGYADFNEVREQSREERNRTEPYRFSVGSKTQRQLGKSIGAHLDLEIANLMRTFEELKSERLNRLPASSRTPAEGLVSGPGPEEAIAGLGRMLMARLRHDVVQLGLHQASWRRTSP